MDSELKEMLVEWRAVSAKLEKLAEDIANGKAADPQHRYMKMRGRRNELAKLLFERIDELHSDPNEKHRIEEDAKQ